MAEDGVTFKATVNGLILVLKEDDDFSSLLEKIERKLDSSGRFFRGASISVKYRGRKLTDNEENEICKLMESKTGAQIRSFEEDVSKPPKESEDELEKPHDRMRVRKLFFKGIDEGITKFYRGTVRSGQLISFNGNVVVIGDVNPGGEIEATGNVIVAGTLRGIVHAGADGNKEAYVVAFNLQPTQLRIADVITRSPDEMEQKLALVPELAYIKDDMVYIERFLPQFK